MSTKGHRAGNKFGGSHTTVIPLAAIFVDIAATDSEVSNITCGIIQAGLRSAKGQRRIKITDMQGGHTVVSSRQHDSPRNSYLYSQHSHHQTQAVSGNPQPRYSSLFQGTSR